MEFTSGKNIKPFFLWKLYFSEVFHKKGGFDVVIGNPPYVRVDNIPLDEKTYFKENFNAAVGKYDLYYLFFELCFKILKNRGILSYITPNKYCAASSAKILRNLIFKNISQGEIVSTSKLEVFDDVSNYPIISLFIKNQQKLNMIVREAQSIGNLSNSNDSKYCLSINTFMQFPESVVPININQKKLKILLSLLKNEPCLGNYLSISEGLRIPTKYEDKIKSDFGIVKQYQFKRWTLITEDSYISEINLDKVISKNSVRYTKLFKPKILIAEDSLFITATYDEMKFIPQGGVYFGTLISNDIDIKYILGLLNSKLFSELYKILFGGMHMGGGYLRYRTNFLEKLPMPFFDSKISVKIINLVNQILVEKQKKLDANIIYYEREIDNLTFHLFNLSNDEIKIIQEI
ncbi:Eco57I restriction-modification methylase domain-containing protein [Atribacter laminatus]|uniref:site-specific DNA-methyltransferase (adenine-specific) n=1 Tax=Atribacter laminatus TaxID=2847778 RepID=A0A7T1AL18_ATRLM|nr:Eco57I restriction-modification methylase domain-containing protein [Atribacter laminatus]QPM67882.1 Type IIS restriction enzyme Eco57I [Atribacter laminatus]